VGIAKRSTFPGTAVDWRVHFPGATSSTTTGAHPSIAGRREARGALCSADADAVQYVTGGGRSLMEGQAYPQFLTEIRIVYIAEER
jgi:hypothetical protein